MCWRRPTWPTGQQMSFTVHYDGWPTQLAQDGSRDSLPTDDDPSVNPGYDPGYDPNYDGDSGFGIAQIIILLVVLIIIIRILSASDGYRGGFGTHYVFVNGLWFPAGPDGRPRPAPTAPGRSPGLPGEAAGSAAAAGAEASAAAASAAGDTVPAPAAARAPAPVPAREAAGPDAAPRISMARCIWTGTLPTAWKNSSSWGGPGGSA